jgi:dihydrofolate reductase
MKLTTTTWISVDGVMQGLGDADEDRRGGFERGGWAMPHADPEVEVALNEAYERADAFLFGHWTFDVFAGSWGTIPAMRDSAVGRALNSKPKYVVSSTLTDPGWDDTTVISGDLGMRIGALKQQPGGNLLVPGGGTLIRALLADDLADEIQLFVAPVILGQGTRLFPESGPDHALDLVGSRVMANGVTVQNYRLAGRPQYGATAATTTAWEE